MTQDGDSTIICHTNTKNLLKNNEICCLKAEILSEIDLECSIEEELGTIPLVFSPKFNGLEIIRADTGFKVSELEITNVSYIKWFIPGKYLEDFNNFSQEQELGIVTVDSQNILDFYPRIFNPIRLKNDVIVLFTSYFRDDITGRLKLSVLVVECDGNITRWVPFESNSTVSRNVLKRQIKLISDANVLLELNNLKVSINTTTNSTNDTNVLGVQRTSELMNKALELNRKLFLVSFDGEICIMDSVNLGIIRIVNLGSQINSLHPYIDIDLNMDLNSDWNLNLNLCERLVISGSTLSVLDLDSLETVYEYTNRLEEFEINFNFLNTSEILNVKVDIINPNIFIISSKCKRIYLLDISKNNLVNFVNISTNKLYLYYYIFNNNKLIKYNNIDLFMNNNINNNNTNNNTSNTSSNMDSSNTDRNKQDSIIRFGCIGMESYNLVAFDIFKLKLLYNRVSIPNKINIISNSQLQPNLLLTSSENSLIQFDIHYTHTSQEYNQYNNNNNQYNIDNNNIRNTLNNINSTTTDNNTNNDGNNNNIQNKIINNINKNTKNNSIERNITTSRILTNNLIGIKKYKNIIKSEITCITFHPRLPNICSVGCKDGSLYLFFLEFENIDLFEFILVHKFNNPIKGLVWHLVPGGLNEDPNLNKKNFLQRVWKSIYSSKYTSILLIQLDELEINLTSNNNNSNNGINGVDISNIYTNGIKINEYNQYNKDNNNITNTNNINNINNNNNGRINNTNSNNISNNKNNKQDDINSIYFMKLAEKPKVYKLVNKDEEDLSNKCKLFSVLIIQYPPTFDTSSFESNDFTDKIDASNEINKPIKYNNFSLICDHICLVYHTKNWVLLRLFWMDWNLNIHLVKRFRIKIKGDITNIVLTHKQYNQYLLYNNINDSEDEYEEDITNNQCLDKLLLEQELNKIEDEEYEEEYSDEEEVDDSEDDMNEGDNDEESSSGMDKNEEDKEVQDDALTVLEENDNKNKEETKVKKEINNEKERKENENKDNNNINGYNNNNHNLYYDIKDDPEYKPLTCTNPLQQYLMLSTDSGYVYITTLVRMYNNISLITNSINGTSGYLSISEESLLTDEIFIDNNNISELKFTILHSFHSPVTRKFDNGCLCSNNCYFILAIGLDNLILIYRIIFDHYENNFKLVLLHYKKCNYNNFTLITEPYNYFKLLINSNTGLSSYSFSL